MTLSLGATIYAYRDDAIESHATSVEMYEAQAQAVAIAGLPTIYGPTVRSISFFVDYLNLLIYLGVCVKR